MCEAYGIDERTRFLVLYYDAKLNGPAISRLINKSRRTVGRWVTMATSGEDIRSNKKSNTKEIESKINLPINENLTGIKNLASRIGDLCSNNGNFCAEKGSKYQGLKKEIEFQEQEIKDFCKRSIFDGPPSHEMKANGMAYKNKACQCDNVSYNLGNEMENIKYANSVPAKTFLDIDVESMNGDRFRKGGEGDNAEMDSVYLNGELYFIQDNRRAEGLKGECVIKKENVKVTKFPKESHDLTVILNRLCSDLKERVIVDAPASEKELRTSLLSNWEALITEERLRTYFE